MTKAERVSLEMLVGKLDGKLDAVLEELKSQNGSIRTLYGRVGELDKWRSKQAGYLKGFLAGFGVIAAAVAKLTFFTTK